MHLYQNFQMQNKGQQLKDRFWACARASHLVLFDRQMERLREVDEEAFKWIKQHAADERKWCKAHFPLTVKSDMLCNNLSESFNAFILPARDKPIITMLETIRRLCMERIRDRRLAMERKDGLLCPRIRKLVDDRFELSKNYEATWNGASCFEVEGLGHRFIVDVETRECSCRIWQLTGIPCAHSIPCLIEMKKDPVHVVDKCYHRNMFLKTYKNVLFPTSSASLWKKTGLEKLAPPNCVRLAGRPKNKRIRGKLEVRNKSGKMSSSMKGFQCCGLCGEAGHNRRGCKKAGTSTTSKGDATKKAAKGKATNTEPAGDEPRKATPRNRSLESARKRKAEALNKLDRIMKTGTSRDNDEEI